MLLSHLFYWDSSLFGVSENCQLTPSDESESPIGQLGFTMPEIVPENTHDSLTTLA